MNAKSRSERNILIVSPDEGRRYSIGEMEAIFKADGAETGSRYSVSEWWLDANGSGPGSHSHPEDHIFYVLAGTLTVTAEGRSFLASQGAYIVVPGGVEHDFANQGEARCGFISINVPGGFEAHVQEIVRHLSDGVA